jgi:hypothetical protein
LPCRWPLQDDLDAAESEALYRLIELSKEGPYRPRDIFGHQEEIDRLPPERRGPHRAVYAFPEELPTIEESELVPRILSSLG